jgi:recombinational DNA repair protein (RecF pathway)
VSNITYIKGRGDIGTLVSTRLLKHYGTIVQDIERVQLGYELIKLLNKITEDQTDASYFDLLESGFEALDDKRIDTSLIKAWFSAQLLAEGGFSPNLSTTSDGQKLDASKKYSFSYDDSAFIESPSGTFTADHIKFLRLLFSPNKPKTLQQVQGIGVLLTTSGTLAQTMRQTHLGV